MDICFTARCCSLHRSHVQCSPAPKLSGRTKRCRQPSRLIAPNDAGPGCRCGGGADGGRSPAVAPRISSVDDIGWDGGGVSRAWTAAINGCGCGCCRGAGCCRAAAAAAARDGGTSGGCGRPGLPSPRGIGGSGRLPRVAKPKPPDGERLLAPAASSSARTLCKVDTSQNVRIYRSSTLLWYRSCPQNLPSFVTVTSMFDCHQK